LGSSAAGAGVSTSAGLADAAGFGLPLSSEIPELPELACEALNPGITGVERGLPDAAAGFATGLLVDLAGIGAGRVAAGLLMTMGVGRPSLAVGALGLAAG
jgi:hypothetical protein